MGQEAFLFLQLKDALPLNFEILSEECPSCFQVACSFGKNESLPADLPVCRVGPFVKENKGENFARNSHRMKQNLTAGLYDDLNLIISNRHLSGQLIYRIRDMRRVLQSLGRPLFSKIEAPVTLAIHPGVPPEWTALQQHVLNQNASCVDKKK